jgi:hypothetical protein
MFQGAQKMLRVSFAGVNHNSSMKSLELQISHNPFFIYAHTISSAVRNRIQYRLIAVLYSFSGGIILSTTNTIQ